MAPIPDEDTLHPERLRGFVSAMIESCNDPKKHPICEELRRHERLRNRRLPTRLIDVGSTPIHLHETKPHERAEYICLSHRWVHGSCPSYRLTTQTLSHYKAGIQLDSLPLSFSDAVQVCRELGFQYLWIDSLCIVQDDTADCSREISRMADTYSGSFLTIAANSGKNNLSALRSTTDSCYAATRVPFRGGKRKTFDIYVRHALPHTVLWCASQADRDEYDSTHFTRHPGIRNPLQLLDAINKNERTSTLLTRGWIFQERLLSPRVLRFDHQELIFECMEGYMCECGGIPASGESHPVATMRGHNQFFLASKQRYGRCLGNASTARNLHQLWRTLVQEYSTLNLSYSTDRLLALSGLANQVVKGGPLGRYIAGMWEADLISDLLWEASHRQRSEHDGDRCEVDSVMRQNTPTWSWASFGCCVNISWRCLFDHDGHSTGRPDLFARVYQLSYDPEPGNKFGDVLPGACIALEGQVTPATFVGGGTGPFMMVLPGGVIERSPWTRGVEKVPRFLRDPGRTNAGGSATSVHLLRMARIHIQGKATSVKDMKSNYNGRIHYPVKAFVTKDMTMNYKGRFHELFLVLQADETHPEAFRRIGILDIPDKISRMITLSTLGLAKEFTHITIY